MPFQSIKLSDLSIEYQDNSKALNLIFKDFNYDGMIHLCMLDSKSFMKNIASIKSNDLIRFMSGFSFSKNCNYYITANTTKRDNRVSVELFSLNNIVIDIDCHADDIDPADRASMLDAIVNAILRSEIIPDPSIIHWTGRGLQLWYHLETCSAKLKFLYSKTVGYLANMINKLILELDSCSFEHEYKYISVDTSSSLKSTGLFRMFCSYNTNTGRKTEYSIVSEAPYNLNDLLNSIMPFNENTNSSKKNKSNSFKFWKKDNYQNLQRKRIRLIKWLIKKRNNKVGEERRDIMLFLAYNAAVQIMNIDAARNTIFEINNMFKEPLTNLNYIFKYIEKKGFLRFHNEVYYSSAWLDITADELKEYEKDFKPVSNFTRDRDRRERKTQRNKKIYELYQKEKSLSEIASIMGLCVATVKKVLRTVFHKDIMIKHCKDLIAAKKEKLQNEALQLTYSTECSTCATTGHVMLLPNDNSWYKQYHERDRLKILSSELAILGID